MRDENDAYRQKSSKLEVETTLQGRDREKDRLTVVNPFLSPLTVLVLHPILVPPVAATIVHG